MRPDGGTASGALSSAISILLIFLGLVVVARTIQLGVGGGLGLLLGGLLVLGGALRLYLSRRVS
jgi:hypothetical protein